MQIPVTRQVTRKLHYLYIYLYLYNIEYYPFFIGNKHYSLYSLLIVNFF